MQEQSVPSFQLFLAFLGIALRAYAGRKRDYVSDITNGIEALKDKARNDMILVLGKLLRDIKSLESEPGGSATDGGENAVVGNKDSAKSAGDLIAKWKNNDTVRSKLWEEMIRITQTLQKERAEEGEPEEMLITELQNIRRDLRPGADLERARQYKRRIKQIEQILQWSLTVVVLLSCLVLLALVLPESSEPPVPGAVFSLLATYGPTAATVLLLFAAGLALVSRYYRSQVSELFTRNDIKGYL